MSGVLHIETRGTDMADCELKARQRAVQFFGEDVPYIVEFDDGVAEVFTTVGKVMTFRCHWIAYLWTPELV